MDIYKMYLEEPYEVLAPYMLKEAEELVQHYCDFFDQPLYDISSMYPQSFDVYPCIWRREEDDSLVQIAPRPEMNLELWKMANRRFASQVLAVWEKSCRHFMPNRLSQIAWREARGIDEWEEGLVIQMIVFFDGDFDPTFNLGMPSEPTPLTKTEREELIKPHNYGI